MSDDRDKIGVSWRLQYPATGAYLVELTLSRPAIGEAEIIDLLNLGGRLANRINREARKAAARDQAAGDHDCPRQSEQ